MEINILGWYLYALIWSGVAKGARAQGRRVARGVEGCKGAGSQGRRVAKSWVARSQGRKGPMAKGGRQSV